jgi:hypothetical protein
MRSFSIFLFLLLVVFCKSSHAQIITGFSVGTDVIVRNTTPLGAENTLLRVFGTGRNNPENLERISWYHQNAVGIVNASMYFKSGWFLEAGTDFQNRYFLQDRRLKIGKALDDQFGLNLSYTRFNQRAIYRPPLIANELFDKPTNIIPSSKLPPDFRRYNAGFFKNQLFGLNGFFIGKLLSKVSFMVSGELGYGNAKPHSTIRYQISKDSSSQNRMVIIGAFEKSHFSYLQPQGSLHWEMFKIGSESVTFNLGIHSRFQFQWATYNEEVFLNYEDNRINEQTQSAFGVLNYFEFDFGLSYGIPVPRG